MASTVLPMGWKNAMGIMQHAHRRLMRKQEEAGLRGLPPRCEIRKDKFVMKRASCCQNFAGYAISLLAFVMRALFVLAPQRNEV